MGAKIKIHNVRSLCNQSQCEWFIKIQIFYYSSYYNCQNHLNTSLNVWHWEKTNQQEVSVSAHFIRTLKYLCTITV